MGAERRLYLRKMSQEKSKATKRQKDTTNKTVKVEESLEKNIVLSKVVIKPKIKRKSKLMTNGISLQAMANLAIHHDKGVRNFESHEITKKVQQTKLKRRQSHSKVRLNARIRQAKAKAAAISKLPKVKKIEKILMKEEKNTISTNVIVPLVVSEIKEKETVETVKTEEKEMSTEIEVPLNKQEEQQQLQLQEEQQPQQQQQQQQPREIGKGWWQMYDVNSEHYYYECVGKQTTWEWPQEVPKEIELKKLPLPLPPPTTLKIIT